MMKKYLSAAAVGLSILLASAAANAKVIDFEDITFSTPGSFQGVNLTNQYGLTFTGGRYNIPTLTATSYTGWGAHSGSNYAWGDGYATPIEISGKNITLNSFWVRAGVTTEESEITVRAFKDNNVVASKTFSANADYHLETFNFAGIDTIYITSRGAPVVILDDIDIGFAAPVPEPGSYAMLLGGLGLLLIAARRQRRS
ncbi:PEP-CTERM sorting domain-containing protein [Duganella sp.]|uniref:PEP-CTERM sorting domain-containing protein n=1 Tax=Duganella sp. TaxID=1904440 RepID=UPI0031E33A7A